MSTSKAERRARDEAVRVLVVDDDPSLAEMLTIVLRGEGFDTAVIGDGSQALTAESTPPDIPTTTFSITRSDGCMHPVIFN